MGKFLLASVFVIAASVVLFYWVTPEVGKGRASALFKNNPINSSFVLQNGEKIAMPWHIYNASSVMLIGEAQERKIIDDTLTDLGLYPLVSSNSNPIIGVGSVRYEDGAAGSYDEIYVSFFASRSPTMKSAYLQYLGFILATNPHLSFVADWIGLHDVCLVVWKMYVTTDFSLRGGREIWGYPKERADIKFNEKHFNSESIRDGRLVENGKNAIAFVNNQPTGLLDAILLPFHIIGKTVTPRTFMHTIGDSSGYCSLNIKLFAENDVITFDSTTKLGAEMTDLQFTPWLWYDMPIFEAVLHAPYFVEKNS